MREKIALKQQNRSEQFCGKIELDESYFGGSRKGKRGRGAQKKKKISVVVEKAEKGGISRAYARSIADFSAVELKKIFTIKK